MRLTALLIPIFLMAFPLAATSEPGPVPSMQCILSDLYINLSFAPGETTGLVDFTVMRYLGHHGHPVPLPEHLFGPLAVSYRPEGTHYVIEGADFRFLVKPHPFGGFTGLLRQMPSKVAEEQHPSDYPFACEE